jgi:hypothetical protein
MAIGGKSITLELRHRITLVGAPSLGQHLRLPALLSARLRQFTRGMQVGSSLNSFFGCEFQLQVFETRR